MFLEMKEKECFSSSLLAVRFSLEYSVLISLVSWSRLISLQKKVENWIVLNQNSVFLQSFRLVRYFYLEGRRSLL